MRINLRSVTFRKEGTFVMIVTIRVRKKMSAALCVAVWSAGRQGCVNPYFSTHAVELCAASGKGYPRSLTDMKPQHSNWNKP